MVEASQSHAEESHRIPDGARNDDDGGQTHCQRQRRDRFERLDGDGQTINQRHENVGDTHTYEYGGGVHAIERDQRQNEREHDAQIGQRARKFGERENE